MAGTAINPADLAALSALFSSAGQLNWSQLLGGVQLGTPLGGTPTLSEDEMMGYGPPEYSIPGFGTMTAASAQGLTPEQKNAVLQQWSSIVSPGQPWTFGTLTGSGLDTAFNKMLGEIGSGQYAGYGMNRPETLARDKLNADVAFNSLNLLNNARVDPFRYEAIARGVQGSGIPNSVASVFNGFQLPKFQAPGAAPAPNAMSSLLSAAGITAPGNTGSFAGSGTPQNPGGGTGSVMAGNGTGSTFTGTDPAGQSGIDANSAMNWAQLVAPNKLNGTSYMGMDQSGRDFIGSLYKNAWGIDPQNLDSMVKATLPQFRAPAAGSIAA